MSASTTCAHTWSICTKPRWPGSRGKSATAGLNPTSAYALPWTVSYNLDGSLPSVEHVVTATTFLFAAGQDTTARLLSAAMAVLAERPDLQGQLRADRSLIPDFIEETLRIESPLRGQFRMARVRTTLAGVDIPAGASVLLLPGAANRDPRFFQSPNRFDIDRPNARKHLGFGFGIHTCAGAPLARAEGRVTLNRVLDSFSDSSLATWAGGDSATAGEGRDPIPGARLRLGEAALDIVPSCSGEASTTGASRRSSSRRACSSRRSP